MKTKLIASLLAASAVVAGPVQAETTVTTAGGLKVQTGKYKFEFGGRIMYDYNKAELNGVTDEDDFDLRRDAFMPREMFRKIGALRRSLMLMAVARKICIFSTQVGAVPLRSLSVIKICLSALNF